ncbi:phosphate acyltransferase [Lacticaseibacillus paracasei subsp. paracasei Lpp70]|nr:phosphate acyltransferase [Lacticaseibacillus paracasei subsp. paracasei Lpp70]
MKIAIDAMGGDNAPEVVIAGVEKARDANKELTFFCTGMKQKLNRLFIMMNG